MLPMLTCDIYDTRKAAFYIIKVIKKSLIFLERFLVYPGGEQ